MKRGTGLLLRTFFSILAVSLGTVLVTGFMARRALAEQFESYLIALPERARPGMRMGRMVLGAAERAFIDGTNQSILLAALIAVVLAAVAAYLFARFLTRPLAELTRSTRKFAAGDLSHRVELDGPEEFVDLAQAFNEMADSLSEAETLRRRMVADVAHELRNPIASLRAQAEAVADGVLVLDEPRARSLVEDIGRLSHLVDDLQELSLAEAGRFRYDPVEFEIDALIEREIGSLRPLVSPGVTLSAEGMGGPVVADEGRLAQVLRNLIANALTHTRSGSVIVAASRTATDTGPRIRVEVRDTGPGIPEKDLPYIFERFYRADTSRSMETGGAGIGLAIARRIVEDHGGEVFATSEPGVLTVVGFEIPGDRGPHAT